MLGTMGFITGTKMTLSEIAERMGLSREMGRLIQKKAINKIKAKLKYGILCKNPILTEFQSLYKTNKVIKWNSIF